MNFLVIGHSVVDEIFEKQSHKIKPGGIYYTVISLLSLVESKDKIFLCTNTAEGNPDLFGFVYNQVENTFIRKVKSIPFVKLVISENGERKETYTELAENIILPKEDLDLFDGILINMITGYDVSLNQLNELRKNFDGLIYFDVHTLSRGVDNNLERNFRRIKNFDLWTECIDILQANESELQTLSDKGKEIEIVEELLSYGIKQVLITRSDRGATVYFLDNKSVVRIDEIALKVKSMNKVGCGDVFGAVYFYNYIKNKNVKLALEKANIYAGIATTYNNEEDFLNLKNDADEWTFKR